MDRNLYLSGVLFHPEREKVNSELTSKKGSLLGVPSSSLQKRRDAANAHRPPLGCAQPGGSRSAPFRTQRTCLDLRLQETGRKVDHIPQMGNWVVPYYLFVPYYHIITSTRKVDHILPYFPDGYNRIQPMRKTNSAPVRRVLDLPDPSLIRAHPPRCSKCSYGDFRQLVASHKG